MGESLEMSTRSRLAPHLSQIECCLFHVSAGALPLESTMESSVLGFPEFIVSLMATFPQIEDGTQIHKPFFYSDCVGYFCISISRLAFPFLFCNIFIIPSFPIFDLDWSGNPFIYGYFRRNSEWFSTSQQLRERCCAFCDKHLLRYAKRLSIHVCHSRGKLGLIALGFYLSCCSCLLFPSCEKFG